MATEMFEIDDRAKMNINDESSRLAT